MPDPVIRGKRFLRHVIRSGFVMLLAAACTPLVPAATPPQLAYSPGAFVIVDEDIFEAGSFRVDYPDGWRVIKISVASAPVEVVFASPDDSMLIRLSEVPLPEQETPAGVTVRSQTIRQGDITINVQGQTQDDKELIFDTIFTRTLDAVQIKSH